MSTKLTLTENAVAFFITYESGKVEAFTTAADRARVIAEIAIDDADWNAAPVHRYVPWRAGQYV